MSMSWSRSQSTTDVTEGPELPATSRRELGDLEQIDLSDDPGGACERHQRDGLIAAGSQQEPAGLDGEGTETRDVRDQKRDRIRGNGQLAHR